MKDMEGVETYEVREVHFFVGMPLQYNAVQEFMQQYHSCEMKKGRMLDWSYHHELIYYKRLWWCAEEEEWRWDYMAPLINFKLYERYGDI